MTSPSMPLRDFWHPVALGKDIGEKPVAARLLGTDIVLWRSPAGVVALRDLCIHRGTRLSLGWVDEGQLVCPYHGWCYNDSGIVTRIPAIPPERGIPARARVERYHCQERYGLVFVCLGEPCRPIYDVPEFTQEDFATHILGPVPWRISAARSLENFMDEAHLPWVHGGLLGSRENLPPLTLRDIKELEDGFYYETRSRVANRIDPSVMTTNLLTYRIALPFTILHENIYPDGNRVIDLFYSTPVTETECVRWMVVGRNFALDRPPERLVSFTLKIWEQDRVLIESQRPEQIPPDLNDELHVLGDGPSVTYRRMLNALEAKPPG